MCYYFAFVFVSIFVFTYFEAKYYCEWESCVFRYHLCRGPGRGTYSLCRELYTARTSIPRIFVFYSNVQSIVGHLLFCVCKELYTALAFLILHIFASVFCICLMNFCITLPSAKHCTSLKLYFVFVQHIKYL